MRISVVVPLYNKAAHIRRCLNSILAQTHAPLEIIVIDDGSTDGGDRIARQINSDLLHIFQQPNSGPGAARNAGLLRARGELIAFLDADDEWLPDFLERAVAHFTSHPAHLSCVTLGYLDSPGDIDRRQLWRDRALRPGVQDVGAMTVPQFVHAVAFMSPCTTISRVERLRAVGGFFERDACRYAEDAYLWLVMLLNSTVLFDFTPAVRLHRDASDLSATKRVRRELEPFLRYPEDIRAQCPGSLRPILDGFLAVRAYKTACAWSYWGDWRSARQLRGRFHTAGGPRLPYSIVSSLASTPIGAFMGRLLRMASRQT